MSIVYALATPAAKSAICVFRVSGEGCLDRLSVLFGDASIPPRVFSVRPFYNSGLLVDTVGVLVFSGGKSYTGEDSFEVHAHGGLGVMSLITEAFDSIGFEEAAPANLPSEKKSAHAASLESNAPGLSFGDLLAIGLSSEFIKAEIKISEFEGAIEKDALLDRLVEIFIDPKAAELFQPRQNVVFIGPPGSGKSTLIAGLMQNITQQSSEKPQVLHVSEEVLFETDRLSFYARVLNFAQSRQKICSASNILAPQAQISEIAWEKHPEFCAVFKRDGQIFSHVHVVMVLPAEMNAGSMDEILRVSPANLSVIFNKCDYGRASPKQLMSLYNRGGKVAALTGDPSLQSDLKAVDVQTLKIFFEYILPV